MAPILHASAVTDQVSSYMPVVAYAILTVVSGWRLWVHRARGCSFQQLTTAKFAFHGYLFAFAVGRTIATAFSLVPALGGLPVLSCNALSGCSYISLLLFLEMHWRDLLRPLAAVRRTRMVLSWAAFALTNLSLYAFIGAVVYIEWSRNGGQVGDMYWSSDVVDALLVAVAVSYTSTAVRMYVRVTASLKGAKAKDAAKGKAALKHGGLAFTSSRSGSRRGSTASDGGTPSRRRSSVSTIGHNYLSPAQHHAGISRGNSKTSKGHLSHRSASSDAAHGHSRGSHGHKAGQMSHAEYNEYYEAIVPASSYSEDSKLQVQASLRVFIAIMLSSACLLCLRTAVSLASSGTAQQEWWWQLVVVWLPDVPPCLAYMVLMWPRDDDKRLTEGSRSRLGQLFAHLVRGTEPAYAVTDDLSLGINMGGAAGTGHQAAMAVANRARLVSVADGSRGAPAQPMFGRTPAIGGISVHTPYVGAMSRIGSAHPTPAGGTATATGRIRAALRGEGGSGQPTPFNTAMSPGSSMRVPLLGDDHGGDGTGHGLDTSLSLGPAALDVTGAPDTAPRALQGTGQAWPPGVPMGEAEDDEASNVSTDGEDEAELQQRMQEVDGQVSRRASEASNGAGLPRLSKPRLDPKSKSSLRRLRKTARACTVPTVEVAPLPSGAAVTVRAAVLSFSLAHVLLPSRYQLEDEAAPARAVARAHASTVAAAASRAMAAGTPLSSGPVSSGARARSAAPAVGTARPIVRAEDVGRPSRGTSQPASTPSHLGHGKHGHPGQNKDEWPAGGPPQLSSSYAQSSMLAAGPPTLPTGMVRRHTVRVAGRAGLRLNADSGVEGAGTSSADATPAFGPTQAPRLGSSLPPATPRLSTLLGSAVLPLSAGSPSSPPQPSPSSSLATPMIQLVHHEGDSDTDDGSSDGGRGKDRDTAVGFVTPQPFGRRAGDGAWRGPVLPQLPGSGGTDSTHGPTPGTEASRQTGYTGAGEAPSASMARQPSHASIPFPRGYSFRGRGMGGTLSSPLVPYPSLSRPSPGPAKAPDSGPVVLPLPPSMISSRLAELRAWLGHEVYMTVAVGLVPVGDVPAGLRVPAPSLKEYRLPASTLVHAGAPTAATWARAVHQARSTLTGADGHRRPSAASPERRGGSGSSSAYEGQAWEDAQPPVFRYIGHTEPAYLEEDQDSDDDEDSEHGSAARGQGRTRSISEGSVGLGLGTSPADTPVRRGSGVGPGKDNVWMAAVLPEGDRPGPGAGAAAAQASTGPSTSSAPVVGVPCLSTRTSFGLAVLLPLPLLAEAQAAAAAMTDTANAAAMAAGTGQTDATDCTATVTVWRAVVRFQLRWYDGHDEQKVQRTGARISSRRGEEADESIASIARARSRTGSANRSRDGRGASKDGARDLALEASPGRPNRAGSNAASLSRSSRGASMAEGLFSLATTTTGGKGSSNEDEDALRLAGLECGADALSQYERHGGHDMSYLSQYERGYLLGSWTLPAEDVGGLVGNASGPCEAVVPQADGPDVVACAQPAATGNGALAPAAGVHRPALLRLSCDRVIEVRPGVDLLLPPSLVRASLAQHQDEEEGEEGQAKGPGSGPDKRLSMDGEDGDQGKEGRRAGHFASMHGGASLAGRDRGVGSVDVSPLPDELDQDGDGDEDDTPMDGEEDEDGAPNDDDDKASMLSVAGSEWAKARRRGRAGSQDGVRARGGMTVARLAGRLTRAGAQYLQLGAGPDQPRAKAGSKGSKKKDEGGGHVKTGMKGDMPLGLEGAHYGRGVIKALPRSSRRIDWVTYAYPLQLRALLPQPSRLGQLMAVPAQLPVSPLKPSGPGMQAVLPLSPTDSHALTSPAYTVRSTATGTGKEAGVEMVTPATPQSTAKAGAAVRAAAAPFASPALSVASQWSTATGQSGTGTPAVPMPTPGGLYGQAATLPPARIPGADNSTSQMLDKLRSRAGAPLELRITAVETTAESLCAISVPRVVLPLILSQRLQQLAVARASLETYLSAIQHGHSLLPLAAPLARKASSIFSAPEPSDGTGTGDMPTVGLASVYGRLVGHIEREEEAKAGARWLTHRLLRLQAAVVDVSGVLSAVCGLQPITAEHRPGSKRYHALAMATHGVGETARLLLAAKHHWSAVPLGMGRGDSRHFVSPLRQMSGHQHGHTAGHGNRDRSTSHGTPHGAMGHTTRTAAAGLSEVGPRELSTFRASTRKKDAGARHLATNLHVQTLSMQACLALPWDPQADEGGEGVVSVRPLHVIAAATAKSVTVGAPASHWHGFRGGQGLGLGLAKLLASAGAAPSAASRELAINAGLREVEDARFALRSRADVAFTQAVSALTASFSACLQSALDDAAASPAAPWLGALAVQAQAAPHAESSVQRAGVLAWLRLVQEEGEGVRSLRQWLACGWPAMWESLLSAVAKERGMVDDARFAVAACSLMRFLVVDAEDMASDDGGQVNVGKVDGAEARMPSDAATEPTVSGASSSTPSALRPVVLPQSVQALPLHLVSSLDVALGCPPAPGPEDGLVVLLPVKGLRQAVAAGMLPPEVLPAPGCALPLITACPAFITVGINEMATAAAFVGGSPLQTEVNTSALRVVHSYCRAWLGHVVSEAGRLSRQADAVQQLLAVARQPGAAHAVSLPSFAANGGTTARTMAMGMAVGLRSVALTRGPMDHVGRGWHELCASVDAAAAGRTAATDNGRAANATKGRGGQTGLFGGPMRSPASRKGNQVLTAFAAQSKLLDWLCPPPPEPVNHTSPAPVAQPWAGASGQIAQGVTGVRGSTGPRGSNSSLTGLVGRTGPVLPPEAISTDSRMPMAMRWIAAARHAAAKDAAADSDDHEAEEMHTPVPESPFARSRAGSQPDERGKSGRELLAVPPELLSAVPTAVVPPTSDASRARMAVGLLSLLKSALLEEDTDGSGAGQGTPGEARRGGAYTGIAMEGPSWAGGMADLDVDGLLDEAGSPFDPSGLRTPSYSPLDQYLNTPGGRMGVGAQVRPRDAADAAVGSGATTGGESVQGLALRLAEDLGLLLRAGRLTSCKSAKDRTGMAVTLEEARRLAQFESAALAGTAVALSAAPSLVASELQQAQHGHGDADSVEQLLRSGQASFLQHWLLAAPMPELNKRWATCLDRIRSVWPTGQGAAAAVPELAAAVACLPAQLPRMVLGARSCLLEVAAAAPEESVVQDKDKVASGPGMASTLSAVASLGGHTATARPSPGVTAGLAVAVQSPDDAVCADVVGTATFLREYGTRLTNTEKNTGTARYAFSQLQRAFFPPEYRAPASTIGGSIT